MQEERHIGAVVKSTAASSAGPQVFFMVFRKRQRECAGHTKTHTQKQQAEQSHGNTHKVCHGRLCTMGTHHATGSQSARVYRACRSTLGVAGGPETGTGASAGASREAIVGTSAVLWATLALVRLLKLLL